MLPKCSGSVDVHTSFKSDCRLKKKINSKCKVVYWHVYMSNQESSSSHSVLQISPLPEGLEKNRCQYIEAVTVER